MENIEAEEVPLYLGKKIREYRKKNKISQEKLAELSNLHYTYISSVERGHRNISVINIYKIAQALHCSVRDFFLDL